MNYENQNTELNTSCWISKNIIVEYVSNDNKICKTQQTIKMNREYIFLKNYINYNKEDSNKIKYEKMNQYIKEKISEYEKCKFIYSNDEWKSDFYKNKYKYQIKKIKKQINAKKIIKIYKNTSYDINYNF